MVPLGKSTWGWGEWKEGDLSVQLSKFLGRGDRRFHTTLHKKKKKNLSRFPAKETIAEEALG